MRLVRRYEGDCRGGPLHGQSIAKVFYLGQVTVWPNKVAVYVGEDGAVMTAEQLSEPEAYRKLIGYVWSDSGFWRCVDDPNELQRLFSI